MKAAIGSLIVLTAMGAAFLPFSPNVLENPSFEDGTTAWVGPPPGVGGMVVAGGEGGSANALELLQPGGGAVPEARQTFPASPGEIHELRGFMLTESALPAGATFGLLKIVFRDDCGSDLFVDNVLIGGQNPDFPGVESTPFLNSDSTTNTWIETVARGEAPAGTTEVVYLILNVDFAVGGVGHPMKFDNIEATVNDGANVLTNPGFETGDTTGWTGPTGQGPLSGAPTIGAQDGSLAIRVKGACGSIEQSFPIAPGEEVSLSGYMASDASLAPGSFALYKIVFRDINGTDLEVPPENVITGQSAANGIESLPFAEGGNALAWLFSEASGTAPADAVEVVFLAINCDFGEGTNPVWFDNVTACTPDPCAGAIIGDINGDGNVNLLDVAGFVEAVSTGEYSCEADINGDGAVNLLDVNEFVALLGGGG